jgi:transcriptional regulator with XRE-family HTH domain
MAKKAIKDVDKHVGALIRSRRIVVGFTQTKLAEAIGLTFQQVQKYEKGKNRVGSSRMVQIGNALGLPPEAFFEGASKGRFVTTSGQSMEFINDFVGSEEGHRLMRAFFKVPKGIQHLIVALVQELADGETE